MIKGQFRIEWREKWAGDGPSDFLCAMRERGMENSNACRDPGGCAAPAEAGVTPVTSETIPPEEDPLRPSNQPLD